MKNITALLFIVFLSHDLYANKDSLWAIWNDKSNADTIRLKAFDDYIWDYYLYRKPDSAKILLIEMLAYSKKKNLPEWQSKSYSTLGNCYYFLGDPDQSILAYKKGMKIDIELKDEYAIASALTNIGSIHRYKGDIKTATEYYLKALRYFEKSENKKGMAYCYNNLAMVYTDQSENEKALEFYDKSLKLKKELNDIKGIQNTTLNLGLYFFRNGEYVKSLKYYNEILKTEGINEDAFTIGTVYHNIGSSYAKMGEPSFEATDTAKLRFRTLSRYYFEKGYEIRKSISDLKGMTSSMVNLSTLYLRDGDKKKATQFAEQSYELAVKTGIVDNIRMSAKALYDVYKETGRFKEALQYFEKHITLKDSLYNEQNKKEIIRQEYQHLYNSRKSKDSLQRAKDKAIDTERIEKQDLEIKAKRTQQYALFGGLALTLLFTAFVYSRLRLIRKQKNIIELQKKEVTIQKHIIEEKHKEITDSINYAERIQKSFLASHEKLNKFLPKYFVYFQPKDVVSGDFYWCAELNNENFLIAVADSTGHGVPGAIMSILNITSLENAVKDKLENPADILNHTRFNIIDRLKKDGSTEGGKDGMDCSLLCFDLKNLKLKFALANNPLCLIRNNELIEYKPDKMPVGKHDKDQIPFSSYEINLFKGDMIYIFTDGYADQFGGNKSKPNGKKFKYSNLQKLFLEINSMNCDDQKNELEKRFINWKQDIEQVDDVCVVGIKL